MAVPHTINDNVTSGAGSNYNRETYYENCFMIDNQPMPIPSSWQVDPQILTRDAKRKIANGVLKAPYICTCYTITWTYKYLSYSDYQKLRQAYIDHCTTDKKVKLYVSTMDSNREDSVFCTLAYTEDGFKAPLYRINPRTGEKYYKDVTFKIVSVGGKDKFTNFFVTRQNFKGVGAFNYTNYDDRIKDIRKNKTDSEYYNIGYTNI